jgi:hypothetical protein
MTIRYFDDDPSHERRALQIYPILIGCADRRETITYGMLAKKLGFAGAGTMGSMLEYLMTWCEENELPAITSIVVNEKNGEPGGGFNTRGLTWTCFRRPARAMRTS